MINRLDVNFGAGGELAFLEGGDPAIVKCSMSMTEMQIWTREDYAELSSDVANSVLPEVVST